VGIQKNDISSEGGKKYSLAAAEFKGRNA